MARKLRLEDLAPYLPYKLQIYYETISGDVRNWTLRDGTINEALLNQNKPILRPLADLTINFIASKRDKEIMESILSGNVDSRVIYDVSYATIQYLFLKHFDVFGLIPKGLAIDINTIKE